ncbi:MAG: alpha/beta hydrolase [Pseudomonadota bacterium]
MTGSSQVWTDFLEKFPAAEVREGCEPCIFLGHNSTEATVLIHGLSDSPYFLKAIAAHLQFQGHTVLLPLLHGHGLCQPDGMRGISRHIWRHQVEFSVATAKRLAARVNIGGFSAGGALSVQHWCLHHSDISGALLLFSGALDLAGNVHLAGFKKWLGKSVLQMPIAVLQDRFGTALIGANPYRYARRDYDGVAEFLRLLAELDQQLKNPPARIPIFAAHSQLDTIASLDAVRDIVEGCGTPTSLVHTIAAANNVSHAQLVLDAPVAASGRELEAANPVFDDMMHSLNSFLAR